DLVRETQQASRRDQRGAQPANRKPHDDDKSRKDELEKRRNKGIALAVETFDALVSERGDSGKIWASVLKEAIKRRRPDFSESYYGFRTFGNLLEEAQARKLMEFGRDEKSGAYVFRGLGAVAGEGLEPVVRSDAAPAERQSNAAGNQRHDFHAVAALSHASGGSGDGGGGRGDRSRGRRGEGSTPSGATQQHANVRHNQQQTDVRTDHQRADAPAERQARTSYFTQPAPAPVPAPAQAQQPYRDEAADNAVAADERAEAAAAAMADALGDAADSVDAAAPAPRRRAASAPRKGSSSGGRKPAAAQADAPAAEPAPSRSRKTATAAPAKAAAAPHARKPRGDGKAAAKPAD
ncbi:MAG: OST-HTH/LOTUS domain-containing protein, partial [Acidovorax sp.]